MGEGGGSHQNIVAVIRYREAERKFPTRDWAKVTLWSVYRSKHIIWAPSIAWRVLIGSVYAEVNTTLRDFGDNRKSADLGTKSWLAFWLLNDHTAIDNVTRYNSRSKTQLLCQWNGTMFTGLLGLWYRFRLTHIKNLVCPQSCSNLLFESMGMVPSPLPLKPWTRKFGRSMLGNYETIKEGLYWLAFHTVFEGPATATAPATSSEMQRHRHSSPSPGR